MYYGACFHYFFRFRASGRDKESQKTNFRVDDYSETIVRNPASSFTTALNFHNSVSRSLGLTLYFPQRRLVALMS